MDLKITAKKLVEVAKLAEKVEQIELFNKRIVSGMATIEVKVKDTSPQSHPPGPFRWSPGQFDYDLNHILKNTPEILDSILESAKARRRDALAELQGDAIDLVVSSTKAAGGNEAKVDDSKN